MGNVRFREERLKFFETFFYYIGMLERSENNLKEPVFSSYHVCPRIEIRFSGLESNCGRLLSRAAPEWSAGRVETFSYWCWGASLKQVGSSVHIFGRRDLDRPRGSTETLQQCDLWLKLYACMEKGHTKRQTEAVGTRVL